MENNLNENKIEIPESFREENEIVRGSINPLTGKPDNRRRKLTVDERKKLSEKIKIGMEFYRKRMKKEKGVSNIFKQWGKKSAKIKKEMGLNKLPKDKDGRDTLQKMKKEKYFLLQTAGLAASKEDAALKAGFDLETARKAEALIETGEDWDKIMKKYFRDDQIASRHFELIMQNKDKGTAMKGIELVYKMKKRFEDGQGEGIAPIKLFITKVEIKNSVEPGEIIEGEIIDEIEDVGLKQKLEEEIKEKLNV